jgi:hypothetical protein
MIIPSFWMRWRVNKQLAEGYRKMTQPMPPVGEAYRKQHEEMVNDPEFIEATRLIDDTVRRLGIDPDNPPVP